jgi:hypothetical protein
MVVQSPADRARAQRRTARAVRSGRYKSQLPSSTTSRARTSQVEYARSLFADTSKIQTKNDEKIMAKYASYAYWEERNPGMHPNADSDWFDIGKEYFYHNLGGITDNAYRVSNS